MYFVKTKAVGIISGILAGMLCCGSVVFAKDISVELQLDREFVEVGDIIHLGVIINNTQNVPAPQLPEIDGFKSQYLGPSTKVSIINGRSTSSITHRYRMVAMKTGIFTLGPFSFTHQGDNYASNTKQIEVVERGQGTQQGNAYLPQQYNDSSLEQSLSGKIFLMVSAQKSSVYINERIALTIKLYVTQLAVRDIQYPLFEGQGFIKEDFGPPHQYQERLADALYDVVEFKTWLYPTKAGQVTIGQAKIKCNIVSRGQRTQRRHGLGSFFDDSFFSDFFSQLQVYPQEVTSEELLLDVEALPEKDKPKHFSGAVGDFQMKVTAAPLKLKAGDPITLNMEISGAGNFDSVQSPALSKEEKFKVYAAQSHEESGIKRFEQVIIPLEQGIIEIPEIVFSFFNPQTKKYVTLKQPPIALEVSAADDLGGLKVIEGRFAAEGASPTHVLGKDIIYIKEDIGKFRAIGKNIYNSRVFVMLQLLPLILFFGTVIFQRQRERLSADVSYARKLRAPKVARKKIQEAKEYLAHGQTAEFYDCLFKTLQEYLGHRFNRPSAGITAEVVEELISAEGLDIEAASSLKRCFSECDIARYAITQLDAAAMKETLSILEKVIDYLERNKK